MVTAVGEVSTSWSSTGWFWVSRAAGFAATVLVLLLVADVDYIRAWGRPGITDFEVMLYSLGMAHYVLSVVYARRRIHTFVSEPRQWLPGGLLAVMGWAVWALDLPDKLKLFYFFGAHHVLNEVYLLCALGSGRAERGAGWLRAASAAFHAVIYVGLATGGLPRQPAAEVYGVALAAAVVVYWSLILRTSGVSSAERTARLCDLAACSTLTVAVLALGLTVRFLDVVFYHFAFWVVWPLVKLDRAQSVSYLGATVLLTLGFGVALRVALDSMGASNDSVRQAFFVGSYAHIALSFMLSSANPRWLTRWTEMRSPATAGGS